jgi:aminoglycoside 3-N-acetyltransferase
MVGEGAVDDRGPREDEESASGTRERELIERTGEEPITAERIAGDLCSLEVPPGSTVIVHSSLSSLGWVCGGAQAVIAALQEVIRPYGTLVMPAHTGHYTDPSGWENPPVPRSWWEPIRRYLPAFSPEVTPTRGMGTIAEQFRTYVDVFRSRHPRVSFSAWGDGALDVVSEHSLEFGLGEGSPLARIYDRDGWVLQLGTGYDTNTSFHLAEYRASFPGKRELRLGAPVLVEGHRRWRWARDIDYDSGDFADIGRAFEKKHGREIRNGSVGLARARLFRQRLCVDFAVSWMERHRRGPAESAAEIRGQGV